jgi:hypothetical protein
MLSQQFLPRLRLQRSKLEIPCRIVPNNELHKAIAQITNSIKQDNSGLGCHKDKIGLGEAR